MYSQWATAAVCSGFHGVANRWGMRSRASAAGTTALPETQALFLWAPIDYSCNSGILSMLSPPTECYPQKSEASPPTRPILWLICDSVPHCGWCRTPFPLRSALLVSLLYFPGSAVVFSVSPARSSLKPWRMLSQMRSEDGQTALFFVVRRSLRSLLLALRNLESFESSLLVALTLCCNYCTVHVVHC